eukprot:TRINITY_DN28244_c0_g2_i1.p1 TRINITY_DN28244_c0_g2~~TRINITY_DN28244_c0_g2_i1.p1  ORF type:complete len:1009 (+),score=262.71 TRINITY_DN28244_c0_g2_i1:148-3174(+)
MAARRERSGSLLQSLYRCFFKSRDEGLDGILQADQLFTPLALPSLPDEFISAVVALDFNCFATGDAAGYVSIFVWEIGQAAKSSRTAFWRASHRPIKALAIRETAEERQIITGAATGDICVWSSSDGSQVAELKGHTQEVKTLSMLAGQAGGYLVSGSRDCTVRLWDVEQGECVHSAKILRNVITRLAAFDDAQVSKHGLAFVQSSEDLRLRLWAVEAGGRLKEQQTLHAGREQIIALDVAPNGMIASGCKGFMRESCELVVWSPQPFERLHSVNDFDGTIEALRVVQHAPSGDMQLFAVSCDTTMKCFTFPELEPVWAVHDTTISTTPYTSMDIAFGNAALCSMLNSANLEKVPMVLFTATAYPEVFVWCCGSQGAAPPYNEELKLLGRGKCGGDSAATIADALQKSGLGESPLKDAKQAAASSTSAAAGRQKKPLARIPCDPVAKAALAKLRIPEKRRIGLVSPLARGSGRISEEKVHKTFEALDRDSDGWVTLEDLVIYLADHLGFGLAEVHSYFENAKGVANGRFDLATLAQNFEVLNPVFISRRQGERLLRRPGSINGAQLCIEECKDCQVYACDVMEQTFVDQCSGCRVVLGPGTSSVFIRECSDCTFWVAARQLRTRDCHRCRFYLYSQTEPVIETSTKLSFAPWAAAYPLCSRHFEQACFEPERNFWNAIFDFTPDKKGGCNWSIVPLGDIEFLTVVSAELASDGKSLVEPDCPTLPLTHELLCAEPLKGEERSAGKSVRPSLPPEPGPDATPRRLQEVDTVEAPKVELPTKATSPASDDFLLGIEMEFDHDSPGQATSSAKALPEVPPAQAVANSGGKARQEAAAHSLLAAFDSAVASVEEAGKKSKAPVKAKKSSCATTPEGQQKPEPVEEAKQVAIAPRLDEGHKTSKAACDSPSEPLQVCQEPEPEAFDVASTPSAGLLDNLAPNVDNGDISHAKGNPALEEVTLPAPSDELRVEGHDSRNKKKKKRSKSSGGGGGARRPSTDCEDEASRGGPGVA